jgi:hypothetical protein
MRCAAHLWRAPICPICAKIITNCCTGETPATERYALVNVETDRVTNSLNTLSEELVAWQAPGSPAYLG